MYDEFDMQAEQHLYPWIDDPSMDASDEDNYCDCYDDDDFCDDLDGDHETGLASAGFGMDEDYGYYGDSDEY